MGVPSFFREILEKYPKAHFWDPNFKVDMLFLDYNAMIHPAVSAFYKSISYDVFQKMSPAKRDDAVVAFVLEYTMKLINETIQPSKLVYFAIDGPAPRTKMQLQRFRRYHGVKTQAYLDVLREAHNKKDPATLWKKSASISPGTPFMSKLSAALWKAAQKKQFMKGSITVILSDSNRPGEGEHKIIPFIRSLKNTNDVLVIYSQDADLIVLGMGIPEHNLYILRDKDPHSREQVKLYPNTDHLYLSIKEYRKAFFEKNGLADPRLDPYRLLYDYVFITFFGGNDFVRTVPFLRIKYRHGGLRAIIGAYRRVSQKYRRTDRPYLVEIKKIDGEVVPLINPGFLEDLLTQFARMEDEKMKQYYQNIQNNIEKPRGEPSKDFDSQLAYFEHEPFWSSLNPFAMPEAFRKINYMLPKNQWKDQYYSHFFGITLDNPREFRDYKKMVCQMYLKSLSYTLRYYLVGLPSWNWFYPFRVAPMPSDILYFLKTVPRDLNFEFEKAAPYWPIEQLSMIVPPQDAMVLPRPIKTAILSPKSPLTPFYPIDFQLDVLAGEKYIYSEPLIPMLVDEIVRPVIQATFTKFTKAEKERNMLYDEPQVWVPKGQPALKVIMLNKPRNLPINMALANKALPPLENKEVKEARGGQQQENTRPRRSTRPMRSTHFRDNRAQEKDRKPHHVHAKHPVQEKHHHVHARPNHHKSRHVGSKHHQHNKNDGEKGHHHTHRPHNHTHLQRRKNHKNGEYLNKKRHTNTVYRPVSQTPKAISVKE